VLTFISKQQWEAAHVDLKQNVWPIRDSTQGKQMSLNVDDESTMSIFEYHHRRRRCCRRRRGNARQPNDRWHRPLAKTVAWERL
jgi:hypothetical protein